MGIERSASAGQRPAWVADALFPFRSRFVGIGGHSVHYVDEGAGPTLLMLHGNPTWSFVYREIIARLSDRFRCVAVDYPGFGLSTASRNYRYRPEDHAQVIADLLEVLDLDAVTLVMQDWGGPIGLHAALRHPHRIRALVIANTWAWPVNDDIHFAAFSRIMGGPIGTLAIRHLNLFVNVLIPAGHRRRTVTAAEMTHYRAPLPTPARRNATAIFPRAILGSRSFLADLDANLPRLAGLPALILWADRDFAFRARERQRWEQRLPNHTTVIISGAGHYLQSDAPTEFADAIADWHANR
jgi:haloalkane dehalogenase